MTWVTWPCTTPRMVLCVCKGGEDEGERSALVLLMNKGGVVDAVEVKWCWEGELNLKLMAGCRLLERGEPGSIVMCRGSVSSHPLEELAAPPHFPEKRGPIILYLSSQYTRFHQAQKRSKLNPGNPATPFIPSPPCRPPFPAWCLVGENGRHGNPSIISTTPTDMTSRRGNEQSPIEKRRGRVSMLKWSWEWQGFRIPSLLVGSDRMELRKQGIGRE